MINRKQRTKGSDLDTCDLIGAWNTPAARKLNQRKFAGLCLGCGRKKCNCKSKRENPHV